MISVYYHRLLRFYSCVEPPEYHEQIELLFGPFARFYHEDGVKKCCSEANLKEAAAFEGMEELVKACPMGKDGCVQFVALCRVYAIWDMYQRNEKPIEGSLPYIIGIVMDTHIRIILSKGVLRISDVYSRHISPELCALSVETPIYCEEGFPQIDKLVELLWKPHMTCPLTSSSDTFDNSRTSATERKQKSASRSSKKQLQKASKISLIPQLNRKLCAIQNDIKQSHVSIQDLKLLKKGLPNPTSIRYIGSTIQKELECNRSSSVVKHMLYCFALGAYKHCDTIAPPNFRIYLYKETSPQVLYKTAYESMNSRELYSIISEYIISFTKTHSALYYILRRENCWKEYSGICIKVCNTILRKRVVALFLKTGSGSYPSVSRNFYKNNKVGTLFSHNVYPTAFTFPYLCKVVDVKRRIPISIINASTYTPQQLSHVYKLALDAPNEFRLYEDILIAMGISKGDLENFKHDMNKINIKLSKRVTRAVARMSLHSKSILYIYLHAIIERSLFNIVPLSTSAYSQQEDNAAKDLIICQSCFTLRSKSRGMGGSKSSGGIIICMHTNKPLCSSCHSENIYALNPCGKIVTSPSISDKGIQSVVVCVRCKILTLYNKSVTIGNTQLCTTCYEAVFTELQPTTCFCGNELSIRTVIPKTFCAISEDGEFSIYAACDKHAAYIPQDTSIIPIDSIKAACSLL